jgi:ferredoxin
MRAAAAIIFLSALAAKLEYGLAFTSLNTRHSILSPTFNSRPEGMEASTCTRFTSPPPKHLIGPLKSTPDENETEKIDITEDERLYRIRLSRATGIEWGTDLSFSFVYVREMDPSGAAKRTGMISKMDQICELRAVGEEGAKVIPLIGAPFDSVMGAFAGLKKTTKEVDLVFFKGSKDELKALCTGESSSKEGDGKIKITVIQNKGAKDEQTRVIVADEGANVRQTLVDEGINVYQSVTRWTNCKGKQLCGTCIINVAEGSMNTNRKSMDEESTLRENPDTYRLSCVTFAYDDVTVETFPPIKAAQWTR